MKKILLFIFAMLLLTACSNSRTKGSYKATAIEGNKSTIVEEVVEETTLSLLGESTKKVIKRNPKDSSAITLNSDGAFSDEMFDIKFDFKLNYFDLTVNNKTDVNVSYLSDYAYFLATDGKKYNLVLEPSWKNAKGVVRTQEPVVMLGKSSTVLNLTPVLNLDYSMGSALDSVIYWRYKNLLSTPQGVKAVNDFVEILIPFKSGNQITTYKFKLKLNRAE